MKGSHAIAPVVIATNQSRSVIYLECIAILFHLSSNAKTIYLVFEVVSGKKDLKKKVLGVQKLES
jgi:hypothetical protein